MRFALSKCQRVVSTWVAGARRFALAAVLAGLSAGQVRAEQTVQFNGTSETIDQSAVTFSIPVTRAGTPFTTITTIATFDGSDGSAGMACDYNGNLYVANSNGTVTKVTPGGAVSTFASGFNSIAGLACDPTGNLYVVNSGGVSKVTPQGVVSPFASGFTDPLALACDYNGNLYVAEYLPGKVFKVTPQGAVSLFASGLNGPESMACDAVGNLYLLTDKVQKVTPQGVVSTFSSAFAGGYDYGLAFDIFGNLYTAENASSTIYMMTPAGLVSTFASGSGLDFPNGLACDINGNIYVANDGNGTVSKVVAATVVVPFTLGGTAVNGTDYGISTTSPLTFTGGQTAATITGTLFSDPGSPLEITFTLGTPTNATLGNNTTNTLTVTEPPLPTVQFAVGSETVDESAGAFSVQVTLAGAPTPTVSTFASGLGQPDGLVFDAHGNLYVANYSSNTVSKVTPGGVVSTFASGFDGPDGLAFDANGNLYVANANIGTVSVVTPGGSVSTFVTGFAQPDGLAFDSAGNLYVADDDSGTVSQVTPGGAVNPFASFGIDSSPQGMAFDSAGNLYVASQANGTVSKVTPGGVVTTFASGLPTPWLLALDSAGNLYVANIDNHMVSEVTPAGVVSTFVTGFAQPDGLAFDSAGNLYVADAIEGTVSKVTPATVIVPFTLGGTAVNGTDYTGVTASPLTFANGQTTATITGNLVDDPGISQTLAITLGSPSRAAIGAIRTNTLTITQPPAIQFVAGSETVNENTGSFSVQVTLTGTPPTTPTVSNFASGFTGPSGLAVDANGNLYVANAGAGTVSKVTPGGVVSTFASGFNQPVGLAFDTAGNLYVANFGNNTVSEVTPAGVVSTLGSGFDGPTGLVVGGNAFLYVANFNANTVSQTFPGVFSTFATLPAGSGPQGLAKDPAGNLYVANFETGTVSMITANQGVVSTLATLPAGSGPEGVAYNPNDGNLYLANAIAGTVSRVTLAGVVSTFASGLDSPQGLAFDSNGNLYVSNAGNGTVSKLTIAVTVPFTLSGTAVNGVAYSNLTASPLTFGIGQTTAAITGTLLDDPGLYQSLNFTLGTPTNAQLAGTTINGMTIIEPPAVELAAASESVNESPGAFSVPVLLVGAASLPPVASSFVTVVGIQAMACDAAGNLYIGADDQEDANNGENIVYKVTPEGVMSTFASGFHTVAGLTFDIGGNLYVSDWDSFGDSAVRKVTPEGVVSTYVTLPADTLPFGLAFDVAGNLYVAGWGDNAIHKVTLGGQSVSTFADRLNSPVGLAIDGQGNVYVSNNGYNTLSPFPANTVTKVTPDGSASTFASGLSTPTGLVIGPDGNLYVGNLTGSTVSMVTPAGVVSTYASGFHIFGVAPGPGFLAIDLNGIMYIQNGNTVYQAAAVSVPFTVGGTAVNGTDYTLTSTNPVTFGIGQSVAYITGTLLADPSASTPTITFALGSPTNAQLGTPSFNTLTITEPPAVAPGISILSAFSNSITLYGTGFDPVEGHNQVTFNDGAVGTVTAASTTSLTVTFSTLPTGAGSLTAVVTTNGQSSAAPVQVANLPPTVQFAACSETADESAGTFSVRATLSGASASALAFASGLPGPFALAFDAHGNLYVANEDGTVRVVTPGGQVSTFAAGFALPTGLAFDSHGNLYVADLEANAVYEVTPAGVVSTFASGFSGPFALAFDTQGNLYVGNAGYNNGHYTVSMVTPAGVVSTFASGLNYPDGLAFDAYGNLYVSNLGDGTVRMVTPGGVVSTFASGLTNPGGLAFDANGNLYVADSAVNTVYVVTPGGVVSTFASGFSSLFGLAFDAADNLYAADPGAGTVNELNAVVTVPFTLGGTAVSGTDYNGLSASPVTFGAGQTTATITGMLLPDPGVSPTLIFTLGTPINAVLGSATSNTLTITEPPVLQFAVASETVNESAGTFRIRVTLSSALPPASTFASGFNVPLGLAFDPNGNLYVANADAGTVSVVNSTGVVNPTPFASGFSYPAGLAFDTAGNLYVADVDANTVYVVTPAGAVGAFATGFSEPGGLAFDTSGNLYVANQGDGTVRVVTPAGAVGAFASGFNSPYGLAFDANGNLYVGDYVAGTVSVVAPWGAVSTFASGFVNPVGLAFDPAGNLYIASAFGGTVSVVSPAGVVSTFASGLDNYLAGLAFDTNGKLYTADDINNTVSKASGAVSVPFTLGGTAVNGTDYNGVTGSPLIFGIGQTIDTITGNLLADPGVTPTLTFALGTPTNAGLGSPTTNTLTITEPQPTPLQSWRLLYFGASANSGNAADSATPQNDGISNLLKFATGMDPTKPGVAQWTVSAPTGGFLYFTYPQSHDAVSAGITFAVQWSDNLTSGAWSSTGVSLYSDVTGTLTDTITDSIPAGASGHRFVRLLVTDPNP